MNKFEKLIRDGFVEIDTSSKNNFELAIENSSLKLDKKSVSKNNRFILLGTKDERDQVEMRRGRTYFYNPLMWKVKSLYNYDDINKGWHDDIKLDERSKEILDSIWPVIHSRVMKMIDCGQ
jgi:hypothetical protein